ncbi:hypothetical protein [Streptomyces sp. I05A-00742]|uniref:hypothetical protein n=1 Tax=Streptomyces sp. I05A-00742 TaxID=2732853 RepID=UPI00148770BB|nr:hypothetical protein [Streptomyces sp. I05A-00742]
MADDHEHDWLDHDDRLDGTALASCAACAPETGAARPGTGRGPDPRRVDAVLAVLHGLAAPSPAPDRPLPGEDAALAAFRAARTAGSRAGERASAGEELKAADVVPSPSAGPPGEVPQGSVVDGPAAAGTAEERVPGRPGTPGGGDVRGGPGGKDGRRGRSGPRSLPRRPVRAALVAALAACALSGVAVASGVVVLPAPFDGAGHEPAAVGDRAGTVSGSGPGANGPSPFGGPSGRPRDGRTGDGRTGDGPGAHPSPPATTGPGTPPGAGKSRPGGGPSASSGAGDDSGEETASPYHGESDGDLVWAVGMCRDYLAQGKWREQADEDAVRTLERHAGGPSGVRALCTRLVRDHEHGGGGGDGGESDEDEDESGEDEDGDDGSEDDDGGHGRPGGHGGGGRPGGHGGGDGHGDGGGRGEDGDRDEDEDDGRGRDDRAHGRPASTPPVVGRRHPGGPGTTPGPASAGTPGATAGVTLSGTVTL